MCLIMNKEKQVTAANGGQFEPVTIKRKQRMCGKVTEYDGERYYKEKIEELMDTIQTEER